MVRMTKTQRDARKRGREAKKRVLARAQCYAAESNLKAEQTRHDLCLQAAGLYEQFWIVLMRSMTDSGKAEETRTLPAIASNYARIMDKIGVTAERMTPEEEEL